VKDLATGKNQNFKAKRHPTIFHALLNANARRARSTLIGCGKRDFW